MALTKHAVTIALRAAADGDRDAADRLWEITYDELHRIADRQLRRERSGHTISATGLVHEVYVRLVDQDQIDWKGRSHFFAVASKVCRHVLVDYARRRRALKRGGDHVRVTLERVSVASEDHTAELIELDQALARLAELNDRLSKVVELRYFGGLTEEETAEALGVTARTVRRDWVKARAWLYRQLYDGDLDASSGLSTEA